MLDYDNMHKVLIGEDIIGVSLPGECGEHYQEENWKILSEEKKNMIRKWVRFMFSHAKQINYKRTSYGLKHSCEGDVGFYVHNDCMKKALILEGYRARTGQINWVFNISGQTTVKKSKRFRDIFKEEIEKIGR